jgi:DNA-binding transcriptional ArsR family regulator
MMRKSNLAYLPATEAEMRVWKAAAARRGLSFAAYMREALAEKVEREADLPPVPLALRGRLRERVLAALRERQPLLVAALVERGIGRQQANRVLRGLMEEGLVYFERHGKARRWFLSDAHPPASEPAAAVAPALPDPSGSLSDRRFAA